MLGFEFAGLQFHDNVTVGRDVVEQEVDEEVVSVDVEVVLASDESEAGPELCQRLGHAQRHGFLQGLFLGFLGQSQEVEH
jgi:hypothetical protein